MSRDAQRGHGVLLNRTRNRTRSDNGDDGDDEDGLALHHHHHKNLTQGELISPVDVHVGLTAAARDHILARNAAFAELFPTSHDQSDIINGSDTDPDATISQTTADQEQQHNRPPVVPLLSATAATNTPLQSDLSPAGMAYAYSDGATSSDTDASHPNSHTSDNEADLGPFTPLTPSNPASSSSSSSRQHRSRTMTTEEPVPSQPQAGPSSAPWRPRELRLVDRQKDGSHDAEHLAAFARQPRAPPSPVPSATDTWVGLGIQLPKSPGIGLDLPTRSPAPTPGPSRSPGPSVTKKGLKPLALPNGGIASAPLPQLLSPALRDGLWETTASSHPRTRTPPLGGGLSTLRGRAPRSREPSKESALGGDVRSGARSPLHILSPPLGYSGETWSSTSTVTSWARESERAAAEAARLPAAVTTTVKGKERSIDRQPSKRRRSFRRRSRSLSPHRTADSSQPTFETAQSAEPPSPDLTYAAAPPSPQQPSSARSSFLSREKPARSRSTRKKGPPTPLVLLPNGRSISRDSNLSGGGGSARSPGSASSQLTSPGGNDAMQSPRRIAHVGGLLTPALPTGSLLSPAFSVYHEALSSPTAPVHESTASVDAPSQQPLLSLKRASTPLKTARINFDDTEDNVSVESVSDYGSDPSFGGSTSAISPSEDVGTAESALYAALVADANNESRDFQSSESSLSEWPSDSLQVGAGSGTGEGHEARESTPTGAQGGLTASSSAASAFGLTAIPSASSSTTEMSSLPVAVGETPAPPSIQVSRSQSFSSDRLASDGHGAVSGDSSDSHEAFEFDGAIEDSTASDDVDRLPSVDHVDEEDSTDRHTPRSQTPLATSWAPEDGQHSITLSSADAEGSTDPDYMQEETAEDESVMSHESRLSSAMGFASPPARVGPLGDLADKYEQSHPQIIDTSSRIGSDLSIDFEQGKIFSNLLSPQFKTSSLFPNSSELEATPKLSSSDATELPSEVKSSLGLSRDGSERGNADETAISSEATAAQDSSTTSDRVIRFGPSKEAAVARPTMELPPAPSALEAEAQRVPSSPARELKPSPSFDTTIFKSPALPRRSKDEDHVGPTDMPTADSAMSGSAHAGFPRDLSPTNDLYMRSLPERTVSPQTPSMPAPVPPPDSASLASRPRLRVNTSSPPPIGDAFKALHTTGDANIAGSRQAFVQSPIPASPIRPMYFPEARSAPLLQGAFPSPAFLSSPFGQQGAFMPFNAGRASRDVDDNYGLSSRWSSGSESEDEAPKRNSKSRRSASTKKRSSSAAPSARNSVSNPPSASAVAAQAAIAQTPASLGSRKSLFQSLGLRKKSLPNLAPGNGTSSNRSSQSGTPASQNSPALPRSSQAYTEFPFPGMTAGTGNPGDASPVASLQSSKPTRSSGLSHIKQRPSLSSQLSAQPSLSHKHSNSSLRTSSSGQKSPSMGEAASPPSSPRQEKHGFNFAIPTPRRRSRASSRASSGPPVPPVPAHARGQSTSLSSADANSGDSTSEHHAAAQEPSLMRPEARNSRGWMKNAMRVNGAPVLKSSQQPPASLPTIASMNFPPEQEGHAASDAAGDDPADAPRSGTPTSNEATPRVAYMSLPPLERSSQRKQEPIRRVHGADYETLSAIGQGLFDSVVSPEVERSNPFLQTHQLSTIDSCEPGSVQSSDSVLPARRRIPRRRAKHLKWRRQRRQQGTVPHYPSMTDVGRLWASEHPGQVLGGADGPQLALYSTDRGSRPGWATSTRGREGDESSSDDYGDSRDDYQRGGPGRTNGQGGGAGGGGRDDRNGESSDDDGIPVIEDSDDTSSSEESEDDYGDADDVAAARGMGNDSESSDDVPLGQQYDRVARVQSRLLAQERASTGSKASASSQSGTSRRQRRDLAASVKQTSTGDSLNPSELTARLTDLQVRRDTRSGSPAVALQDPARASIRRSPELGRSGTTGSQSHASSLARARSLANRVRQKGVTESGDSNVNAASVGSNRGRRSSDAAAKRSQTFNVPPASTMPVPNQPWTSAAMQSSIMANMPPSTNPAVSKAAIVVATQAARDGKIPAAAIPLQAQALALQATQAGVTPGIVSSTPMVGQRTMSSSHNGVASSDNPMSDDRLAPSSGVSRATSTNTTRRRPLGVDTRIAPPMSSPMPSSSGSTKSPPPTAALLEDPPTVSSAIDKMPSASGSNTRRAQQLPGSVRMQQHKVYIVNKQRFAQCEVPLAARARDLVLDTLDRETVQMTPGRGAWVVFEVSPAFGIERPLREYEVVTQVSDALPDSTNDYLLLKQTELAPYLSLRAVPSVSPTLAGYVYVRDRKGKWSKRWLELRDHSIYHAKSDKGKDEVFVCHLSSFDVYLADGGVTKAPKAHSFCLRSQDKISMFENKDDYLHYFCLSDPSAHRDWIRAITNARTYILKQEHAALFQLPPPMAPAPAPARPSAVVTGLTGSADEPSLIRASDGTLSRRGTVKRPSGDVPTKPHSVDVGADLPSQAGPQMSPLLPSDAFAAGPFEKGSLLAKEMRRTNSTANGNRPPPHHGAAAPWVGPSQPQDLSMHERTRARMEQERMRADLAERQRRLKDEGKPLINLGGTVRRAE